MTKLGLNFGDRDNGYRRSRFAGQVTGQYNKIIQKQLALARDTILSDDPNEMVTAIDVGVGL